MNREYHIQISRQALDRHLSAAPLETIIAANLYQDRLGGQIGHDEYHFDNNAFERSYAYMNEQRALVVSSVQAGEAPPAWRAFGRLTHTAQDFYAHSNYIDLWLARQPNGTRPNPGHVPPMDPGLLRSPDLRSGKVYLPWEALTLVGFLEPLARRLLPRDAHAWMNLDSPGRGYRFKYALQAAVKRTEIELENTLKGMKDEQIRLFTGRVGNK